MNETFFNTHDMPGLAKAISRVVALDDYLPMGKPHRKTRAARADRRVYDQFEQEDLWGFVLIPGVKTGWTYLVADPVYCLCGRPRVASRPRLAEIARLTGCEALMLSTYDSCDATLLESLPDGRFHVSGSTYNLGDTFDHWEEMSDNELQKLTFPFFSESIPYSEICHPQFRLLESLAEFNPTLRGCLDSSVSEIACCLAGVKFSEYSEWSELHGPFRSYRQVVEGPYGNWIRMERAYDLRFPGHLELYFKRRKVRRAH